MLARDTNHAHYEREEIVAQYAALEDLTPCEELVFDRHISPDAAILDLGIGAGRTVASLRRRASRYVGIDYSRSMVEAAQARHPGADLRVADAADLSDLPDASFDVVVFSFNGIDCLHPYDRRVRCLQECRRLLRPGGVLIFSVHNPRLLAHLPEPQGRGPVMVARQLVRGFRSFRREVRRVPTLTFWRGRGYAPDSYDRDSIYFHATPSHVASQIEDAGLHVVDVEPATYPDRRAAPLVPWYYYTAVRATSTLTVV